MGLYVKFLQARYVVDGVMVVLGGSAGCIKGSDVTQKTLKIRAIFTDFGGTCLVCLFTIYCAQASENGS